MSGQGDDYRDVEQQLSQALADHTADVEVSSDAYARLASRVADDSGRRGLLDRLGAPQGGRPGLAGWGAARIAVAAVAVAAISAGGVLVAVNATDDQTSDTAQIASEGGESDGEPADGAAVGQGADDETSDGTSDDDASSENGGETNVANAANGGDAATVGSNHGPVATTKEEAARAFVDLLGIGPVAVAEQGEQVVVLGFAEGGNIAERQVAVLDLVEADLNSDTPGSGGRGWAVERASSPQASIESPAPGATVAGGVIEVSGAGTGFESTIDVTLLAATDGSVLVTTGTSAGNFGQPEPYSQQIEVIGSERVWLVVQSSGGADGVAESFSAVPLTLAGPPDPTRYSVVGVEPDDADGGLNVRASTGAQAAKVGLLPHGAIVTRTPDLLPARDGGNTWWPVTGDDGTSGWVNARFLARDEPIQSDRLISLATDFLFVAAEPQLASPWFAVSNRLGFSVVVNGEVVRLEAEDLQSQAGWMSQAIGGRSLADLLAAPGGLDDEIDLSPGPVVSGDPVTSAYDETFFAGLPSITATYLGSDGVPRVMHLYLEDSPAGPVYVGVMVEEG